MTSLLVDSSILIDFLRRRKDRSPTVYLQLLERYTERMAVSIITHTELFSGKSVWERPVLRQEVEALFSDLYIMPFTIDISVMAGRLIAKQRLTIADAIIAATALDAGCSLATLNTKDFSRVDGLTLVSL